MGGESVENEKTRGHIVDSRLWQGWAIVDRSPFRRPVLWKICRWVTTFAEGCHLEKTRQKQGDTSRGGTHNRGFSPVSRQKTGKRGCFLSARVQHRVQATLSGPLAGSTPTPAAVVSVLPHNGGNQWLGPYANHSDRFYRAAWRCSDSFAFM